MPEWTAQRRKAIYQHLEIGELDQAGQAVAPFKEFKQADMKGARLGLDIGALATLQ